MCRRKTFEHLVKETIRSIPAGKVASYGQIAALAGNYRGARQVARVLHSSSEKEHLPWHRVVSGKGEISLPRGAGFQNQKKLLVAEGVEVSGRGRIDFAIYLWEPEDGLSREFRSFIRNLEKAGTSRKRESD
jgi:methylated-DNA-protein-cysteine methyltransferase-like protein